MDNTAFWIKVKKLLKFEKYFLSPDGDDKMPG